jgi:MFS superfamily sulfate permease-like transporter
VLQCEAITDVDVTAADMLERLDAELNEEGIHIAFVELRSRLRDLLSDYGLLGALDREHFYPRVNDALAAIRAIESRRSDEIETADPPQDPLDA